MNENIKVFLRVKPDVENLSHLKDEDCVSYEINNNKLFLFDKKRGCGEFREMKAKTFFFNHIFDTDVKQKEIFESIGKTLVDNFMNGYNSSILAYGNTNSGKTYTLYGDNTNLSEKENKGLIYFCLNYFFNLCKMNKDIELSVSVVEIYLEKIRDLGKVFELYHQENSDLDLLNFYLNFHESMIREDRKGNTYVEDVKLLPIKNMEDVIDIIDLCFKYRKTKSTKKNLMSSRSHCLLTVYQYKQCNFKDRQFISQINFIDLAGSEKFTDIEMVNKQELININNTLSVLNRVIMALSTQNKINKDFEKRNKQETNKINLLKIHIPYRDSKLTRLLKNSLGGNSFTYILICLNVHCYRIDDFINSLIFAKRCKTIKKKVKKNITKGDQYNSDSASSGSETSHISYESYDSSSSNFHFLLNKNKKDIYSLDDNNFYKKKIKTKNTKYLKHDLLNKLIHIFFSIMKNKCQNLEKQKESVINNIIKIVKTEEHNKEELQKNKNFFLKMLKEKKKELYKHKKLLNKIINTKEQKKKTETTTLQKKISPDFLSDTIDTDIINTKNDSVTDEMIYKQENKEKNKQENKLTKKKRKDVSLPLQPTNLIQPSGSNNTTKFKTKEDKINNIYSDIDKLVQLDIQKIDQKVHIIEELNFLNKSLFLVIRRLTNILRNIHQNKYNVIIKNGKKQLNISNFTYEDAKKLYQKKLINHAPSNLYNNQLHIENINKNVLAIYETLNEKEVFHEFQKN